MLSVCVALWLVGNGIMVSDLVLGEFHLSWPEGGTNSAVDVLCCGRVCEMPRGDTDFLIWFTVTSLADGPGRTQESYTIRSLFLSLLIRDLKWVKQHGYCLFQWSLYRMCESFH